MDDRQHSPTAMPARGKRGVVTVEIRNRELFTRRRKELDLTLKELARAVDRSHGYIENISCGDVTRVSLRLAQNIENVLGCPGELFGPPSLPLSDDNTDTSQVVA